MSTGVLESLLAGGTVGERSLLDQLLERSNMMIVLCDAQGRYQRCSRRLRRIFKRFGIDPEGKFPNEILPAALADQLHRGDLQAMRSQRSQEVEEELVSSNRRRVFRLARTPLCDADGKVDGLFILVTMVTAQKRTEDALRNVALAVTGRAEVFDLLVTSLSATLGVDFSFIACLIPDQPGCANIIAGNHNGEMVRDHSYMLDGTPCENVIGKNFEIVPHHLQERFPRDAMMRDMGVNSYAAYPLFDHDGKALGLIGIADPEPLNDRRLIESVLRIYSARAAAEVERRNNEQALRVSETNYRQIFENSEDAIVIHDFDSGAIVDVNPRACEAFGYQREEMLALDLGVLGSGVAPYTGDDVHRLIERARRGETVRFEWHRRRRDGTLHWDEVVLKPALLAGRQRVIGFSRDISERKRAEAALRKSEDRLRATVEAALDCIVSMDSEGRIVEFNPAAERCFGYRHEEVIGRQLSEVLIPPAQRQHHEQGMQRYRESGVGTYLGRRVEVTALRADGSEFPAELAIAVSRGASGDVFIGYLRDITEQRNAEADRVRLEEQLRQAQKMEAIGHLTGGIAHDFNNILTSILGYTGMGLEWLEESHGDEKLTRYLHQVRTAGERARDLIRQMLTFSRGQRGNPQPMSVPSMVAESIELFRSTFPSSISFRISEQERLAPVMIDPIQFEQVLMNLCINARDAMQGVGEIAIEVGRASVGQSVCVSCRQDLQGEFIELSVSDSGPGVAASVLERMFEPFVTTKEVGQGSGMGLSTTHGIVHEHGGHILVENREPGARFRVLLPIAGGGTVVDGVSTRHTLHSQELLSGRVLVVDDEASVREFLRELLASRGLQVQLADSGVEALRLVEQERGTFDLVITDQTMPRISGAELAYRLKALHPALPVVLITGFGDAAFEQNPDTLGVDGVLRKPVDWGDLFSTVRALL